MSNKSRIWPEWYRVIQGRDLLFPANEFKFKAIPEGLWKNVQRRAAALLKEQPTAPKADRDHWEAILEGKVPFSLEIEKKGKKYVS